MQDYFLIVKRPLDMGIIKRNLENCVYTSAKECIQDYRQMFNNCYLYNKPSDVSILLPLFNSQAVCGGQCWEGVSTLSGYFQ